MSKALKLTRLFSTSNSKPITNNSTSMTHTDTRGSIVDNATLTHVPLSSTESPSLTTATVSWTMMSLCLSVLLSALDLTIVTPAVPAIVGMFKTAAGYISISLCEIISCGMRMKVPCWG
ncbi:hypothetical protein BDW67DRAFT_168843 [Aspergillus spinulosporus]